jgi:hypothetical protein
MAAALLLPEENMLRPGAREERQRQRAAEEAAQRQCDTAANEAYVRQLMQSGTMKPCPRCRAGVEKNGGCLHMACRCGHEFWWCMREYRATQHDFYNPCTASQ